MITEIILMIFATCYYMFSVFLMATLIQDTNKRYTGLQLLGMVVLTILTAPTAIPIILGIEIGQAIKQDDVCQTGTHKKYKTFSLIQTFLLKKWQNKLALKVYGMLVAKEKNLDLVGCIVPMVIRQQTKNVRHVTMQR